MGDARKWIAQIFQPNISCNKLIEVGREIAQDQSLKENQKTVLRHLWQSKYKICEIDERCVSNE